jgi:hypothetical protein
MPRFKMVNGERIQLTAAEESARDAEEKAWADGAVARAQAALRTRRNDMKNYRQSLRDFPAGKDTVDKCNNATWPTKP